MRSLKGLVSVIGVLATAAAFGGTDIEQQLQDLNLPTNQAPVGRSSEKIYSVQSRYVSVDRKSEVLVAGGKNFSADSFITSYEIDAAYRFHLNDRWHLTLGGGYVFNSLSSAGQKLNEMRRLVPDVAYVKYRGNLLAGYNLFYGKFRVSMDQVFYFDQYIAVGPGLVNMNTVTSPAAVADVGFVFWFGRSFNAQIGIRDYYYRQQRVISSSNVHDLMGHIDVGYLFGGSGG
jgi:outer membrane beta-barrel protein